MENEEIGVSLTPAQIELMDFTDVEVLREWQNIDVLARSRSGDWCLLIENKIGSKEKKDALPRYRASVEKDMPSAQVIPVLLTVEGEEPSAKGKEAGYVPWSHAQVLELTERMVQQHQPRIPADASIFLNHYLDVLRRITMQDEDLVNLCKTIYRKHRDAIDLIVEYGTSSEVVDACHAQLTTLVDCEFVKRTGHRLWFLPREIGEHEPELTLSDWGFLPRHVPVACWFMYLRKEGRFVAAMEVGPIADSEVRVHLLRAIEAAGFAFSKKNAFKPGAMYTRIVSGRRNLERNESGETNESSDHVKQVTQRLWEDFWKEGGKITDVLKNFDWTETG